MLCWVSVAIRRLSFLRAGAVFAAFALRIFSGKERAEKRAGGRHHDRWVALQAMLLQHPDERVSGPLVHRRHVEERTIQKVEVKELRARLSSFENCREERRDKNDKVTRQEEKVVLRKTGTWTVRRRSKTRAEKEGCRSNCEIAGAAGH